MRPRAESWSTQQLTEFLALVSSFADASSATRGAVERAAEVLECDVVAVLGADAVTAAIGFRTDALPERELLRIAGAGGGRELTGLGRCEIAVVELETDEPGSCSSPAPATRPSPARSSTSCAGWRGCSS